jgi:hypothetical protein
MISMLMVLATPAYAQSQGCAHAVDANNEEILFTFNALLYSATSVASPQDLSELHQLLLGYEANAQVDEAFPIRKRVYDQVQNWSLILRQRALQFVLHHETAATNYNALVLQLVGPAPDFAPLDQAIPGGPAEQNLYVSRQALSDLMRQIYTEGHSHALWQQVRPAWENNQLCAAHIAAVEKRVTDYVRAPKGSLPLQASQMMINPLMPTGSGVTSVYSDDHFIMVLGPTLTPVDADTLLSHELLHPLLNNIFKGDSRLRIALRNAQCVYDYIKRNPAGEMATRYVYSNWESYFSESLVRATSHHLTATVETGAGFMLTPTLGWELEHYDTENERFNELIMQALAKLNRDYCIGPSMLNASAASHKHGRFFHQ